MHINALLTQSLSMLPSCTICSVKQQTAKRCGRTAWLLIAMSVTLVSCANSKFVIGTLYNQFDNQIRSEFNKLTEYNDEQKAAFEAAVGTFHVWHRQSELPLYAALISDVADSLLEGTELGPEAVSYWFDTTEAFSLRARECYPINFLYGTIRSLSDQQIEDIKQHLAQEDKKARERYNTETPKGRVERRLEKIDTWAGRINLNFTTQQRIILKRALQKQISMRKQYYDLSDAWNEEFFTILADRQSPDYPRNLHSHMGKLWTLLEDAYPESWRKNRQLWKTTMAQLLVTLSPGQREQSGQWLATLANTLKEVSRDEPSFTIGSDPSVGCLPESSSQGL